MTIYDEQFGGGPVSALLGDNPGWLAAGLVSRGSGFVRMLELSDITEEECKTLMQGAFPDAPKESAADKQLRILDEARKMESYR